VRSFFTSITYVQGVLAKGADFLPDLIENWGKIILRSEVGGVKVMVLLIDP
jgi:hypothetical protein